MQNFEKLGAFYLGKAWDVDAAQLRSELLLYDARDLTTHAVCVGMTGSGKTGLCLALLEEAAIDGIPAIAIDPKGDLGNLLLTFPELRAGDFLPWVDPDAAARESITPEQLAEQTAQNWRKGLAEWGQEPERIARYQSAVDAAIYTPGSTAGLPLTVLRSFAAPPAAVIADADALRERILSAASGLLALLGIDADPIRSREHILLSNIFDRAWRDGRNLDLAGLIREIQSPPFDKIGVMDLETIFPAADRFALAMSLNNLLASPGFAGWMQGEPLDIGRLLYTAEGRPRLSILSIAHLSDSERMFFVTILLNEIVAWMRSQPGTSSLRAILYMDEVFGYFPPTANPPSKTPMLTLLKQARAYGLGVVLATQNPVDLDYKGLSNAGTWFLGRLQTERDKLRVLDGLEGASAAAGAAFDRARVETVLSGLKSRTFLMNNVHEDEPVVFQTRWVLSYLRGPMTRDQIQAVMSSRRPLAVADAAIAASPAPSGQPVASPASAATSRPVVPPGIDEFFLPRRQSAGGQRVVYRPALLGTARLHYVDAKSSIDEWADVMLLAEVADDTPGAVWETARELDEAPELESSPATPATFAALPSALSQVRNYKSWQTALKNHLYQQRALPLFKCAELKETSQSGETEGDFRIRMTQRAHEQRDQEIDKLRNKYAPKLAALQDRIRRAEQNVETQKSQAGQQTFQAALSFGKTVLGALFGRKLASATNINRAATSARSAGRVARERGDISRAAEALQAAQERLAALEQEFERDAEKLKARWAADGITIEPAPIRPRKSDITIETVALAWTPWAVDEAGVAKAAS